MMKLFESNLSREQSRDVPESHGSVFGSTDMGNVSQLVPSIHPNFHIGGRAVNHTRQFTAEAGKYCTQCQCICNITCKSCIYTCEYCLILMYNLKELY